LCPKRLTILGQWNSRKAKSPPSLSWGEERTKILLLACCYQEGPVLASTDQPFGRWKRELARRLPFAIAAYWGMGA
jgi:hypothetical protein